MSDARGPYRRGRFDVGAWRERVKGRLTTRFALRLHMTLVMGLVFAAAFVTTRTLLALHVRSMGLRYLAASITGYAAFFGLVRAWLWYVTGEAAAELAPQHSPDEVAMAIDPDAPPRSTPVPPEPQQDAAPKRKRSSGGGGVDLPDLGFNVGGGSSSSGSSGGSLFDVDGDGCVAVLIIGIVVLIAAALFGAAGYVIYQAPALLGEAAFEVLLASVLARSSRRVTRDGWSGSVLAATWKPALALLAVATIGGFAAQGLCPREITLGGVIKQCVVERK